MKKRVRKEIVNSIKLGYSNFISGMALGFDMMCAEIVLGLKKKYDIKLICAVPCKNQDQYWTGEQREKYKAILNSADQIRCLYQKYTRWCMQERNKFMVNNSSRVIAFFNGSEGGTKQTIDYAKSKKLEIINLADK